MKTKSIKVPVPYASNFKRFKTELNNMVGEKGSNREELQHVTQFLIFVKTLLDSQETHFAITQTSAVVNAMKRFSAHLLKNRTFTTFVGCLEAEIANAERPERYRGLLVLANEYSQLNKLSPAL